MTYAELENERINHYKTIAEINEKMREIRNEHFPEVLSAFQSAFELANSYGIDVAVYDDEDCPTYLNSAELEECEYSIRLFE